MHRSCQSTLGSGGDADGRRGGNLGLPGLDPDQLEHEEPGARSDSRDNGSDSRLRALASVSSDIMRH